jgi:hypothetical protein
LAQDLRKIVMLCLFYFFGSRHIVTSKKDERYKRKKI